MSDEGKVQREWRFYLDDMATFAKKAVHTGVKGSPHTFPRSGAMLKSVIA